MLDDRALIVKAQSFVYQLIVASAPLLQFAIPRSTGKLKAYYEKHLAEETGHDEMLLDDLKRLGITEFPPNHHAAQLAGSQYYLIAHQHPALLLGYMHALERDSLPIEDVDRLSEICGTNLTALRHHAAHDPGHKADLEEMIASLDQDLRLRVMWNEAWTRVLIEKAMA